MDKQTIASAAATPAIGPYSPALAVGDFVFVSGQIAARPRGQDRRHHRRRPGAQGAREHDGAAGRGRPRHGRRRQDDDLPHQHGRLRRRERGLRRVLRRRRTRRAPRSRSRVCPRTSRSRSRRSRSAADQHSGRRAVTGRRTRRAGASSSSASSCSRTCSSSSRGSASGRSRPSSRTPSTCRAPQVGGLMSATAITYAPTLVVAGWLVDRVGVRRMLVAGTLVASLCIIVMFWAPSYRRAASGCSPCRASAPAASTRRRCAPWSSGSRSPSGRRRSA